METDTRSQINYFLEADESTPDYNLEWLFGGKIDFSDLPVLTMKFPRAAAKMETALWAVPSPKMAPISNSPA